MATDIFKSIFLKVDGLTDTYVSTSVSSVAHTIEPFVVTSMAIYIIFWGALNVMGRVQEPLMEFTMRIVKLAAIVGIALGSAEYHSLFVSTFQDSPAALASAFTMSSVNDMGSVLDKIFDHVLSISEIFWQAGNAINLGALLISVLVFLSGAALTAYAGFLIILSKIAIGLLLGLGPLFIVSLLFDSTQKFFESWIASLVNYGLVIVLAIATNTYLLSAFSEVAKKTSKLPDLGVQDLGPLFVLTAISILLMGQITSIAASLSGGVSLSSMGMGRVAGSMIKKLAGGALSKAASPVSKRLEWRKAARERHEIGRRERALQARNAGQFVRDEERNKERRRRSLEKIQAGAIKART